MPHPTCAHSEECFLYLVIITNRSSQHHKWLRVGYSSAAGLRSSAVPRACNPVTGGDRTSYHQRGDGHWVVRLVTVAAAILNPNHDIAASNIQGDLKVVKECRSSPWNVTLPILTNLKSRWALRIQPPAFVWFVHVDSKHWCGQGVDTELEWWKQNRTLSRIFIIF